MRIRTIYYCAVSGLVIAGLAVAGPAQQASQEKPAATLKVQAREVVLPVTVRDKKGALVTSLQVSDFTLTEDSRPQRIKSFTRESSLPFRVGLLVDTSRSVSGAIENRSEEHTSELQSPM